MVRRRWLWALLPAALIAGGLLFPWFSALEIVAADGGGLRLCRRMGEGECFVLAFTHSVNRRPVFETLKAQKDHIVIVGARFDAFGAGMPEGASGEGTLVRGNDGWLEWTVNQPVPEITVRVGRVAGHTLTLQGVTIALAELAPPGSALVFRVHKKSFLSLWKGSCRG